ncbi:hypothetical protein QVD99_007970 [Batrachochytrium dendrobatidis]|nr:hypothetical protein O5D80_004876 [Batrachochytrium dendrobatidis]KAK5665115.1 hypothetical protein QVD99_007970 [Batrachochytrium dendrobatidis]
MDKHKTSANPAFISNPFPIHLPETYNAITLEQPHNHWLGSTHNHLDKTCPQSTQPKDSQLISDSQLADPQLRPCMKFVSPTENLESKLSNSATYTDCSAQVSNPIYTDSVHSNLSNSSLLDLKPLPFIHTTAGTCPQTMDINGRTLAGIQPHLQRQHCTHLRASTNGHTPNNHLIYSSATGSDFIDNHCNPLVSSRRTTSSTTFNSNPVNAISSLSTSNKHSYAGHPALNSNNNGFHPHSTLTTDMMLITNPSSSQFSADAASQIETLHLSSNSHHAINPYLNIGLLPRLSPQHLPHQSPLLQPSFYQLPDQPPPLQNQQLYIDESMRTLYIGNLPSETTLDMLLNHILAGALEHARILPDKNCAFITFLDASAASALLFAIQSRRLMILSPDVKVGWGKPSLLSPLIADAVARHGASRNVYIGNLDSRYMSESALSVVFSHFGLIDSIKIFADRRIAFVHMASIQSAMKAIMFLSCDAEWSSRRIHYGRDRCLHPSYFAISSFPQSMPQHSFQTSSSQSYQGVDGALSDEASKSNLDHPLCAPKTIASTTGLKSSMKSREPTESISFNSSDAPTAATLFAALQAYHNIDALSLDDTLQVEEPANRTVYLGGIRPEVTTKELCDIIRGGVLQNIKYMSEKNIAFATFVNAEDAAAFYRRSVQEGLSLKSKRLKLGWGKATRLPSTISYAVQHSCASRNVYIGVADDTITEARLRRDFSPFGDIELINLVPEKLIAFVSFTDILFAIKAVQVMRMHPDYIKHKINFGKDRCGNPPRERSFTSANSDGIHPPLTILTEPLFDSVPDSDSPNASVSIPFTTSSMSASGSPLSSLSPPSSPTQRLMSLQHLYLHYRPLSGSGTATAAELMPSPTSTGSPGTPPLCANGLPASINTRHSIEPSVPESTAIISPNPIHRNSLSKLTTLPPLPSNGANFQPTQSKDRDAQLHPSAYSRQHKHPGMKTKRLPANYQYSAARSCFTPPLATSSIVLPAEIEHLSCTSTSAAANVFSESLSDVGDSSHATIPNYI